jgi:hypothetical protein
MDEERQLIDSMALVPTWHEATQEMLANGWVLTDQEEHYGNWLLELVLTDRVSVSDLRGGVVWANALDKEVMERSGGDIAALDGRDRLEAVARRIAHHAGRYALDQVKSRRKRNIARVTYSGQSIGQQFPGMGRLEGHDYAIA